MKNIGYLVRRAAQIDTSRLRGTIRQTAKEAGRSQAAIALDMIGCAFRYMAAPADYALFRFFELTPAQRATYVTRGINNELVKKFNDKAYWHIFDNKDEFNIVFERYVRRDWLRIDTASADAFDAFVALHPVFFYKPLSLTCGYGIEKIDAARCGGRAALFDGLAARGPGLVEQPIVQCEELNRVYAGAVNTIRLVTICEKGHAEVVFSFLRVGNGGVVDNLNSGGLAAPVDPETGIVTRPAADKNNKAYDAHPATGTRIVGFAVPMFREAVAFVKTAALLVPQVGYTAWDVAVTPDGLCLVEGNSYPGHDILQLPPHVPEKNGLMARIQKYLK